MKQFYFEIANLFEKFGNFKTVKKILSPEPRGPEETSIKSILADLVEKGFCCSEKGRKHSTTFVASVH